LHENTTIRGGRHWSAAESTEQKITIKGGPSSLQAQPKLRRKKCMSAWYTTTYAHVKLILICIFPPNFNPFKRKKVEDLSGVTPELNQKLIFV
jgi:hypothetical protein